MNIIKLYYLDDLTGLQASPAQPYRHTLRPFGLREGLRRNGSSDTVRQNLPENAVGRDTVCGKLIFPKFFFQGVRIDLERELQIRFEMMRSQTFDYFKTYNSYPQISPGF
ncbi:unnamed protein product [Rhizophagus irregularis]|nr:unnamed protein product [Rhizophagus irregularis]